jgi:carboxylesterase
MAKRPIGILILHGFAASLDSVNNLEGPLRLLNLPVRMPVLRGHGANSPDALRDVDWRDWVSNAESSLRALLTEVPKIIVVGHGMGGLLALILAANNRDSVDSLVLVAPSIALPNTMLTQIRLQVLQPFVQQTFRRWPLPPSYTDRKLSKGDTNYRWAPMNAILSFFELIEMTRGRLTDVTTPVLILQSKRDGTISPEAPDIIRKGISTPAAQKRVRWFTRSGHEMFRDCERDAIIESVVHFTMERVDSYDHLRNSH